MVAQTGNGGVLISTRGLSKSYGPFKAVDAVDLDILEHDIHVFIGPNGAGKSTVLNLLGGQILPTAGEVYFNGRSLGTTTPSWRARAGIGRSFQLTSIIPGFSCLENVVLAVQAHRGLFSLLRLHSRAEDVECPPSCSRTANSGSSRSPSRWVGGRACFCSTSRRRA
ncbi:MAG: ATP-binding cassette domain-containing protein [Chloroflexi bacterium]|nr:MAG: ATP-binding cassette domain-containing protein [Chloroflexota bacterium]